MNFGSELPVALCLEAEVIPLSLCALYCGLFVASAVAAIAMKRAQSREVRLRREQPARLRAAQQSPSSATSSMMVSAVLCAVFGVTRTALFGIPQSYYMAYIHPESSLAVTLDLLPEALYFMTVWMVFSAAFVHLQKEKLTRVAELVSPPKPAKAAEALPLLTSRSPSASLVHELAAKAPRLQRPAGGGIAGSFQGLLRRADLKATRTVTLAIAVALPTLAVVVCVAVAIAVPGEKYETVNLIVSMFRAVVSLLILVAVLFAMVKFRHRWVDIAGSSLPIALHGVVAAFDFKLRMPNVSCRVQYIMWATYFLVSELVPLYGLMVALVARNQSQGRISAPLPPQPTEATSINASSSPTSSS